MYLAQSLTNDAVLSSAATSPNSKSAAHGVAENMETKPRTDSKEVELEIEQSTDDYADCFVPTDQELAAAPDANTESKPSAESGGDQIQMVQSGDTYDDYFVPTYRELADAPDPNKPTRRPARRTARRALKKLVKQESINMMDFGVDQFAALEDDESTKLERQDSFESNYSCDSKGFMGWKSNREASVTSSIRSDSTNLSKYCGQDGFLTWELTASARAAKAIEVAKKIKDVNASLSSNESNMSKQVDSEGFLAWEVSASARVANEAAVEKLANLVEGFDGNVGDSFKSWHIEDWEGTGHDEPTKHSDERRNTMSFMSLSRRFSSQSTTSEREEGFWKKMVPLLTSNRPRALFSSLPNTHEMDDAKQALTNVRINSSSQNNDSDASMSNFLPGCVSKHIQHLHSRVSIAHSNRSDDDLRQRLSVNDSQLATCSHAADDDTREAIWIKRSDGDVDIEKECRKLYRSQLGNDKGYRRASFF